MKKINCCEYVYCGLYYKHIMTIKYDSGIVNKSLDVRVVTYDCHMFIVQATDVDISPPSKQGGQLMSP